MRRDITFEEMKKKKREGKGETERGKTGRLQGSESYARGKGREASRRVVMGV